MANIPKIEEAVDLSQKVIVGDVVLQIEVVEQLRRRRLPAHHRQMLPTTRKRVNQGTCRAATETFSTKFRPSRRSLRAHHSPPTPPGITPSWREPDVRHVCRQGRVSGRNGTSTHLRNHCIAQCHYPPRSPFLRHPATGVLIRVKARRTWCCHPRPPIHSLRGISMACRHILSGIEFGGAAAPLGVIPVLGKDRRPVDPVRHRRASRCHREIEDCGAA